MNINLINLVFGIGTILMQLVIIKLIITIVFHKKLCDLKCNVWCSKNAMKIAFFVALIATLGSLFYSIVVGWEPCELCWYQRIFLYPQVLLLGFAAWGKSAYGKLYAIWLSGIGAVIAFYQVLLQFNTSEAVLSVCSFASQDCSAIKILEFGYITFPVMSLTVFVLIFILAYTWRK